jgi:hypothetical protein
MQASANRKFIGHGQELVARWLTKKVMQICSKV